MKTSAVEQTISIGNFQFDATSGLPNQLRNRLALAENRQRTLRLVVEGLRVVDPSAWYIVAGTRAGVAGLLVKCSAVALVVPIACPIFSPPHPW